MNLTRQQTQIAADLDRLERSGDKVNVAFVLDGTTRSLPTPMVPAEARAAIATALDLGATRISITRFEA